MQVFEDDGAFLSPHILDPWDSGLSVTSDRSWAEIVVSSSLAHANKG